MAEAQEARGFRFNCFIFCWDKIKTMIAQEWWTLCMEDTLILV